MTKSPTTILSIGVLISGGGTNLQALIDGCENGEIPANIVLVISNNPDAYGLKRAREKNIPTLVIDHRSFPDRQSFDLAMTEALNKKKAQLICLAGFMRVLSTDFVRHFQNRLINIHPSLLPAFPGLNVQKKAIDAGVRFSGATVHFVVPEVDAGPIIIQAVVPILSHDTPPTLATRILKQEHRIYPLAVRWFAENRLVIESGKVQVVDGNEDENAALVNPLV